MKSIYYISNFCLFPYVAVVERQEEKEDIQNKNNVINLTCKSGCWSINITIVKMLYLHGQFGQEKKR